MLYQLAMLRNGIIQFPNVKAVLFKRINNVPEVLSNVIIQKHNRFRYSTITEKRNEDVVIYEGPLSRQILRVKLFSLVTSLSGLVSQPLILSKATELGSSTSAVVLLCSVVGFFTFVTPLLLHYVTKKYVTSVLYIRKDDSYIATTYSLFLRRKQLYLKPGDGILPDIPGMFTSISVRGTPLFIDVRYFSDVQHYKRIMGFDRPIDFKLKK